MIVKSHNRMQRRLAFRLMHSAMMRWYAQTGSTAYAKNAGIVLSRSLILDQDALTRGYHRARAECHIQDRIKQENRS